MSGPPLCSDCRFAVGRIDCNAPQNRRSQKELEREQRERTLADAPPRDPDPWRWTRTLMRGSGWLDARLFGYCGREGRWFRRKQRTIR